MISLSQLTRYLATKAEEMGVEIYPGFAADGLVYGEDGKTVAGMVYDIWCMMYYVVWSVAYGVRRAVCGVYFAIHHTNNFAPIPIHRCLYEGRWHLQDRRSERHIHTGHRAARKTSVASRGVQRYGFMVYDKLCLVYGAWCVIFGCGTWILVLRSGVCFF
ncbi:hypothetical protein EON63_05195 [archaeon]|nr:MAG: hypothetical protein EON63_05195 [archaeon]